MVIDATSPLPLAGGRVRILREARLLFTVQGYAAVSMQQIADAAGVNKATLYHHFDDKEDLFVSVMAEEFARLAVGLGEVVAEGGALRDQLTRVAVHIFSSHKSDFGRLTGDLHEHVSERRRTELMARCTAPWEHIRVAIERSVDTGQVRAIDPEWVAHLFFVMVGSQIWWSKVRPDRPAPDERVARDLAAILLDGIASPAESHAPADDAFPVTSPINSAAPPR